MKNRASFVLMEGLVMILVFALAAAICLQVFVRSDARSRQTQLQTDALVLAQNGAESIKAAAGDMEKAARILGAEAASNAITLRSDDLELRITGQSSDVPGLGKALVTVWEAQTGEVLISFTTGWQEVGQ